MTKIYLTARFARQSEMREVRTALQAIGHTVTSRWLDEELGVLPADAAQIDLDDIDASDAVLVFTESESVGYTTGGRHVELGYAIAKGIPIYVRGPLENVFCHLPQIKQLNEVTEL